jgi:hypothetical protein
MSQLQNPYPFNFPSGPIFAASSSGGTGLL